MVSLLLVPAGEPKPAPFDKLIEFAPYFIRMPNEARAEILQGTLDLMILQTLAALGPQHGYAIAARLEQISSGVLQLNMGTLYPGLTRLEARGWISAKWGVTDSNRRARFYDLTVKGRKQLATERAGWLRMADIMAKVLE
jgi:PadR family transcriptional regulator, regulatory protein PadR